MDFSVDFDPFDGSLSISTATLLLRISATATELLTLRQVGDALWADRGSLAVGTVGSIGRAYWSAGQSADTANLLVGTDDETWDLALELPRTVIADIVTRAEEAVRSS